MQPPPVVSIITPVYNGAEFLDECIQSVLMQSYQDWEYIIYDNRSTDETARIADSYAAREPRIRVIHATNFVNQPTNHNRALNATTPGSRYVKFVHADDRLLPECLERMVSVAEAHPSVGFVTAYHLTNRNLGGGGVFGLDEPTKPGREVLAAYLTRCAYVAGSPTTVLYRADVVRKPERFFDEEDFHFDTEAACRLLLDHDCGFVPQVLTFTRLHAGGETPRSLRINSYISSQGRFLLRFGPPILTSAENRRLRRRFLLRYAWFLGKQALRPCRYKDADYQQFHQDEIACLRAEAGNDPETQVVLAALACLVPRTALQAPSEPAGLGPGAAPLRSISRS